MKIFLAADHAGFVHKEKAKEHLKQLGHEVVDCGVVKLDPGDDYPQFMRAAAEGVAGHHESRGILFGGSGQGEAMVANRVKGVRAAVFYGGDKKILTLSREHNDANILAIGARFMSEEEALRAIDLWLKTPFSNEERHKRRISQF